MNQAKEQEQATQPKQIFRLHRKLFLLVFAIALLWQVVLGLDTWTHWYAQELQNSFKVILTVQGNLDNDKLSQLGDQLNRNNDILTVRLFSPQDALQTVMKQNAQLAQAVLLMGKNKMPSYFEITLSPRAINNLMPFMANLAAEYSLLHPHYNAEHAQFAFYASVCAKLMRVVMVVALLVFLLFMFLVEAVPSGRLVRHSMGGVVSGLLAGIFSGLLLAGLIYPVGYLAEALASFTTAGTQVLLVVFCGLLGWTLSKWQRF